MSNSIKLSVSDSISSDKYYKIATITASNNGNSSCLRITGTMGEWGASKRTSFDISVSNRDGVLVSGFANSMSNYNSGYCNIVIYNESDGKSVVYWKRSSRYCVFLVDDVVIGHNSSYSWEGEAISGSPSGTLVWTYTSAVGLVWAVNGKVSETYTSDKVGNSLSFGSKTYDGSSAQTITAGDLGAMSISGISGAGDSVSVNFNNYTANGIYQFQGCDKSSVNPTFTNAPNPVPQGGYTSRFTLIVFVSRSRVEQILLWQGDPTNANSSVRRFTRCRDSISTWTSWHEFAYLDSNVASSDYVRYQNTNEINFKNVPSGNSNVWFNYRNGDTGGFDSTSKLTDYYFGDKNKTTDGITLHASSFTGTSANSTKWNGYKLSTTWTTSSDTITII